MLVSNDGDSWICIRVCHAMSDCVTARAQYINKKLKS